MSGGSQYKKQRLTPSTALAESHKRPDRITRICPNPILNGETAVEI